MQAERHSPELLQRFLVNLEATQSSFEVWRLIVDLGRHLQLPFIDFISASSYRDWKKTLFVRTSYDATWINAQNSDPEICRWSYFRSHGVDHLTPVAVGLEFLDEYREIPESRVKVLKGLAERGMRAGFSIPLRQNAPPQAAQITFGGDLSRREMLAIIHAHGWTLHVAALMGHQCYLQHFAAEFPQRNAITAKQQELLALIGAGMQDKQIADQLGVTVSAVRQRMNALSVKCGVTSRAEMAALAMSLGILPDPLNRPGGEVETVTESDGLGMLTAPAG